MHAATSVTSPAAWRGRSATSAARHAASTEAGPGIQVYTSTVGPMATGPTSRGTLELVLLLPLPLVGFTMAEAPTALESCQCIRV
jgi:hypothetical protein